MAKRRFPTLSSNQLINLSEHISLRRSQRNEKLKQVGPPSQAFAQKAQRRGMLITKGSARKMPPSSFKTTPSTSIKHSRRGAKLAVRIATATRITKKTLKWSQTLWTISSIKSSNLNTHPTRAHRCTTCRMACRYSIRRRKGQPLQWTLKK